ncbi:unnamed protein product [Heterobilharzia americana]|nr:unnamed protein product [Heterobilharzia americana]
MFLRQFAGAHHFHRYGYCFKGAKSPWQCCLSSLHPSWSKSSGRKKDPTPYTNNTRKVAGCTSCPFVDVKFSGREENCNDFMCKSITERRRGRGSASWFPKK